MGEGAAHTLRKKKREKKKAPQGVEIGEGATHAVFKQSRNQRHVQACGTVLSVQADSMAVVARMGRNYHGGTAAERDFNSHLR